MTEFNTPIDIANRAMQHCGADLIDPTAGFAEDSKRAGAASFSYGKVRRAELRRNVWKFATRRAVLRSITPTTMLLVPSLWSPNTTYFIGSIVADQNGNIWISSAPSNLNNDPLGSANLWQPYFGPMTVSLFDATVSYSQAELVYTAPGDGTNKVFLSLVSANSDDPATPTTWDATATYFKNQVVEYAGVAYMSLTDLNTNQQPNLSPALWDSGTTYAIGNKVIASDGLVYSSLTNANTDHDPVSNGGVNWQNTGVLGAWTTVFVGGKGSSKWIEIGGSDFAAGVTLAPVVTLYPVGSQARSQANFRNYYRLPCGFLREAPQNPNQITSWLGGPSGITYSDLTIEGDFFTTADGDPIPFRFVADVTDVRSMDDMFCEGLAARIAMEICESLTQSTAKLATIAKVYDEWISQARTVNGIETGSDVPPDDDYITVRM